MNLFKVLAAALQLRPDRRTILSERGNFPTDLYIAQGLVSMLGKGYRLDELERLIASPDVGPDIAATMLTQVDYRDGSRLDMAAVTARVHEAGAISIWDLAHSAGAFPVDLNGAKVDFAVGCGYKYLNGGPGAPAFIYVRPGIGNRIDPALAGWMGHEAPFVFDQAYRPGAGVQRMRVGTPPILSMAALDAALDVWVGVSIEDVRVRSIELSERFIAEVEQRCPQLVLASPRDPAQRGSQVSFRFADGYPAMQALIALGVIGDFRAPDIMRFGFTPLYLDMDDVVRAAEALERIIRDGLWDRPEFHKRAAVT